jgi:hypothetical protein
MTRRQLQDGESQTVVDKSQRSTLSLPRIPNPESRIPNPLWPFTTHHSLSFANDCRARRIAVTDGSLNETRFARICNTGDSSGKRDVASLWRTQARWAGQALAEQQC